MKKFNQVIKNLLFLTMGAFIAAFALETFLVPNNIIDGGIVGISIMLSAKTALPLGYFTFFLNLPFLFLAFRKFGGMFVFYTFWSVSMLSCAVTLMGHIGKNVQDPMLACIFGGVLLGCGCGLILRNNGSLDGTEIIAIRLSGKMGFSVGEIIMFFNIFIFFAAGIVFSWSKCMYSLLTYFIAYKVIDIVLEGLNESKSVRIISENAEEIGQKIMQSLNISVTYLDIVGGYSGESKKLVYCIISRLQMVKMKELIKSVDPSAFFAIGNVHEVEGVRIKKHKNKHM